MTDRTVASGSLADAAPTDLLACGERGGLTGTLRVRRGGEIVEMIFDAGLLTAVTLDGHQAVVVDDVWGWPSGDWAFLVRPALEPVPDPTDSGLQFLREVEVAAVELLDVASEVARLTEGDSEVTVPPEARGAKDRTVKIVYLDTTPPDVGATPISGRYAKTDVTAVVVYEGARGGRSAAPLPTPGDPIEMALAKVDAPEPEPERLPAPVEPGKPRSDIPWALILTTLVLLGLIVGVLFLLNLTPDP